MATDNNNIVTSPKTGTFQMRINPRIKKTAEEIYAAQGLTLTDAVNIFIQQSINAKGLPFLASDENKEYLQAKAVSKLLSEIENGWNSAEKEGWVSEEDAYRLLGIEE